MLKPKHGLSAPVVCRPPMPSHAAMLGDVLEVAVALCRLALGRVARHGRHARWHDHVRRGMALSDAAVNAVLVVGTVARERLQRSCCLVKHSVDLGRVVRVFGDQRRGQDLTGAGVHAQVSIRHDRRVAVPRFPSSHSALPHSLRPVLSTSRCRGSLPTLAPAFPGRSVVQGSGEYECAAPQSRSALLARDVEAAVLVQLDNILGRNN